MMIKILMAAVLTCGLTASAFADDIQPRLVSVTGEGEVSVVPDRVVIHFQVESFDADLAKAKRTNDDAVKKTLALVKKYAIDPKDAQTDYFTVRNEERYFFDSQTNQQRSKKGFFVTKNITVRLKDISKFEDFYSEALAAGVNNINGVTFESSQMETLRSTAREKAITNARQKALELTRPVGEEIGRVYSIQESGSVYPVPVPRMMMARADMAQESADNQTIALGQIKISATAAVSFELK